MEKGHATVLEHEIFGDSDDEEVLEDLAIEFSSDEEEKPEPVVAPKRQPLPKFKRKANLPEKIKKKRRISDDKPEEVDVIVDPIQVKLNEATMDFEAAISRIKPKRFKKNLEDETQIDDMSTEMLRRMKASADMLNREKQIATAKINMLPDIAQQFSKTHFHEQFLENQILEGVKAWLEPMHGDGSLPPINVQKEMMKALEQMPIRTDQLRESGIGKVAMFYAKCDLVENDIKKRVKDLLDKWMRPIMNRSDNYKDRTLLHAEYDAEKLIKVKKSKGVSERTEHLISTMIQNRARLPNMTSTSYNVAPISNVNATVENKLSDKQRKLKNKMILMRRK